MSMNTNIVARRAGVKVQTCVCVCVCVCVCACVRVLCVCGGGLMIANIVARAAVDQVVAGSLRYADEHKHKKILLPVLLALRSRLTNASSLC
jgi:hypothetical protein